MCALLCSPVFFLLLFGSGRLECGYGSGVCVSRKEELFLEKINIIPGVGMVIASSECLSYARGCVILKINQETVATTFIASQYLVM